MFVSELVSYSIFFELIHIEGILPSDPSPFMEHSLYSVFLVITAGILLDRILLSKKVWEKVVYILFFTTVTANLFINAGRSGYVVFFFMLLIVIVIHYRVTLKSLLLLSLLAGAIPYMAFKASPTFHNRALLTYNSLSHFSYDTSIGIRIGLGVIAKDIFMEHPLLGVGVGDYMEEKINVIETKYPKWLRIKSIANYHNSYAEILVIAGIFGLLAFLMVLVSLLRVPIKDPEIRTIKIFFIPVFAIASLSDPLFHLNQPLSIFALFAGLIVAQSRYEREEIKAA
jgi:O-antigen ligase